MNDCGRVSGGGGGRGDAASAGPGDGVSVVARDFVAAVPGRVAAPVLTDALFFIYFVLYLVFRFVNCAG